MNRWDTYLSLEPPTTTLGRVTAKFSYRFPRKSRVKSALGLCPGCGEGSFSFRAGACNTDLSAAATATTQGTLSYLDVEFYLPHLTKRLQQTTRNLRNPKRR